MNSFINAFLSITLSWIRGLVNQLWQLLASPDTSLFLQFISRNWLYIVIVLCAVGVVVDGLVYFFRWRPDYVWAAAWRRLRARREPQAETPPAQQQPAQPPDAAYAPMQPMDDVEPVQTWAAAQETPVDEDSLWDTDEPLETDWDWDAEEEPSFGAAQPEPLAYFRDVQAGFAPAVPPEQLYAPRPPQPAPGDSHPGLDEEHFRQNLGLDAASNSASQRVTYAPAFRPFTVTHEPEAEKPQGAFQRFARRAKDFMAMDDEPKSIRNLQSNVDVTKAFHDPVYPQPFNRDEE